MLLRYFVIALFCYCVISLKPTLNLEPGTLNQETLNPKPFNVIALFCYCVISLKPTLNLEPGTWNQETLNPKR
jgi:hypothetical protein